MGKAEKTLQRFLNKPKDFTWAELTRLLKKFGYVEAKTGKTSGSGAAFVNHDTKQIIRLHKPHSPKILRSYQLDDVEDHLKKVGVI